MWEVGAEPERRMGERATSLRPGEAKQPRIRPSWSCFVCPHAQGLRSERTPHVRSPLAGTQGLRTLFVSLLTAWRMNIAEGRVR